MQNEFHGFTRPSAVSRRADDATKSRPMFTTHSLVPRPLARSLALLPPLPRAAARRILSAQPAAAFSSTLANKLKDRPTPGPPYPSLTLSRPTVRLRKVDRGREKDPSGGRERRGSLRRTVEKRPLLRPCSACCKERERLNNRE